MTKLDACATKFLWQCDNYSASAGCFSWPSDNRYKQSEAFMVPWLEGAVVSCVPVKSRFGG